ncbi:MAG: tRNA (adenosine(37)-N6)-dimethylallyltransferase MiaA [Candidatus Ryanbacteria bacterium CG10_big_fil_rev_8_21_14_0_10_43_42]|uniref:tRNA dimethylallyltransferase n=1 Tax=Candidatus Ryanbacteria bacterium CG10_big_fil_rev_8_21_14_0_10_43_42 TaxID=1974864 RepID=A0A2M8KWV8_9BACT|nr:MAG: tRNA (adenosine(37)-N6)-dimethylallyltransferase MiaA [Candidatus Ryanbacteria bacterium CG10_big_fil_rev_8_21_14_0_10_43_42]
MPARSLIAIVGPTASGKSELAVFLAKKYDGEIISADSRQVYRDLAIGTNKISGQWQKRDGMEKTTFTYKNIPHYCIDFIDPKETYTVAEFKNCADKAIKDILSRDKTPFLVGGTGLYIDAVVYGIVPPKVPPNKKLREDLSEKTTKELFALLQKCDPARADAIDPDNPRRLIRAIEITTALGSVPLIKKDPQYNTLMLGIKRTEEETKKRITHMVHDMLENGLINEVQSLIKNGIPKERIRELGFEYSYALEYLKAPENEVFGSLQELEHVLIQKNWQYAKRQMTWFKRDKNIRWISSQEEAEDLIQVFLAY